MIKMLSTLALLGAFALGGLAQDKPSDPPIPADKDAKTTASGLKYSILEKGKGEGGHPKFGDSVTCQYRGWRPDGTVFDSSYDRPGSPPATFQIGQVIEGWNEGLALMSPGDKFKFTIPWQLAYGEAGQPRAKIGPKMDLIFVVELLSFERGPDLPDCPTIKADGEGVKKLEDGTLLRHIPSAKARTIAENDLAVVHWTLWNTAGKTVHSTKLGRGQAPMVSTCGGENAQRWEFMKKFFQNLKTDGTYHLQVPPALFLKDQASGPRLPANSTTLWHIEVMDVIPFAFDPKLERKKTASGLEYEVIRAGKKDGKQPTKASTVVANYVGWTDAGLNFDSSFSRGQAASFPLGNVIAGWQEGIPLMTEGSIFRFKIPWKDAYGEAGNPRARIGPKTDLVFYVELVEVK